MGMGGEVRTAGHAEMTLIRGSLSRAIHERLRSSDQGESCIRRRTFMKKSIQFGQCFSLGWLLSYGKAIPKLR